MMKPPATTKLVKLVEAVLDGDKAEGVVVVDLSGKTDIADYMVIASGTSKRQIGAMAEHLQERIKASGVRNVAVEGAVQCDWVVVDAGAVIVHLFRPEIRTFYDLEKLWATPAVTSEARSRRVAGMRP
ncbi:MAG: ribosome silencing factor [Rhodospirillales bacterium]|nr:ribosome silencing factor [Rhodospirillales bacterium]